MFNPYSQTIRQGQEGIPLTMHTVLQYGCYNEENRLNVRGVIKLYVTYVI